MISTSSIRKITALAIFALLCGKIHACEVTPYFKDVAEATAYVNSGKPVEADMILDSIHFRDLPVLKALIPAYPFPLDTYPAGILGSPLADAINRDAPDIVHYLIKEKQIKPTGMHIHLALDRRSHYALTALLKYQVDVTGTDYHGRTPLQRAKSTGDTISEVLLEAYLTRMAKK